MESIRRYLSPLGGITLAGDGEGLTGLRFDRQAGPADVPGREYPGESLPVLAEAERWLDLYFSGKVPDFTPKLNLRGTAFRKAVWEILLTVPYGRTVTYGEIAEQMGLPRGSARAVGGAVGQNPVLLIVPCHRVLGRGGSMTGYAGGISRKVKLLEMEKERT